MMNRISYAALAAGGLAFVFAAVVVATRGSNSDGSVAELAALRNTTARLESQIADTAESIRALEASVAKTTAEAERTLAEMRERVAAISKPDPARLREIVREALAERVDHRGDPGRQVQARAPEKPKAPEKLSWQRKDINAGSLKKQLELDDEKSTQLAAVYRERAEAIDRVWRESREKGLFGHAAMQHVWKAIKKSDEKFAEMLTPVQLAEFKKMRGRDHPRGRDFHVHRRGGHKARPREEEKPPAQPKGQPEVF